MALPERIGPFEIVRLLGAGGMGEVFLARDPKLDRMVAIKRMLNVRATPSRQRERFRREAKIAARLDHPAIVRIHGMIQDDDEHCIVMEYVAGTNLFDFLGRHALSVAQVVALAQPIAEALAVAHDHDIVHRDLKSENVLLTRTGQVKITDFGIAKMLGEDTLTSEGALVGTVRAMSPEQVKGRSVDRRSDMFSFGTLLYEMLSGTSPFLAETSFDTFQHIVAEQPAPITDLVDDLPPALCALMDQLLAKDPRHRPGDFHDIARALDELCDAYDESSKVVSLPEDDESLRAFEDRAPSGADPDDGDGLGQSAVNGAAQPADGGIRAETPVAGPGVLTPGTIELESQSGLFSGFGLEPRDREEQSEDEPDDLEASADATDPARRGERKDDQRSDAKARRRGRLAVAVALAAVVALAGFILWPSGAGPGPASLQVAILEPIVESRTPRHELLIRHIARDYLAQEVDAVAGVSLVPHYRVDQELDQFFGEFGKRPTDVGAWERVRANLGVQELIISTVRCQDASPCTIAAERVRAGERRGRPVVIGEFVVKDDLSVADLDIDFATALSNPLYPSHTRGNEFEEWLVSPDERLALARLQRDFWDVDKPRRPVAIRLEVAKMRDARGGKPFLKLDAFEVMILFEQFLTGTHDTNDYREEAQNVLKSARNYASGSALLQEQALMLKLADAIRVGQQLAKKDVEQLQPLLDQMREEHPYSRWTFAAIGRWNLVRRQYPVAAEQYRHASEREPSVHILAQLVSSASRAGKQSDERANIDVYLRRLQRMAPGNYEVQRAEAWVDSMRDDTVCEKQKLKGLVKYRESYEICFQLSLVDSLLGKYHDLEKYSWCVERYRTKTQDLGLAFNFAEAAHADGNRDKALGDFIQLRTELDRRYDKKSGDYSSLDGLISAHQAALEGNARLREHALAKAKSLEENAGSSDHYLYYAAASYALLKDSEKATELVTTLLERKYRTDAFQYPWFAIVPQYSQIMKTLQEKHARSRCASD